MMMDTMVRRSWSLMVWVALAFGLALGAYASICPVMMVSGTGERDQIVVTIQNTGKLPIRRLEFACASGSTTGVCREGNALFYPGMQYTLRYPYPGGKRAVVTVAIKSLTMANGFVFKPSKKQPCRTLRITPGKSR